MKKTLFTAALAFVLSLCGFVLSAQTESNTQAPVQSSNLLKLVVASKTDAENLILGLSNLNENNSQPEVFGYKVNGEFCSLASALQIAENAGATESATNLLGSFSRDTEYAFGFENETGFNPVGPTLHVASDPLFYGEFSSEGFYQLDFSKDPFDGMIDIYVMGEPLPASTVTMLIALAAAGAFLLYRNRKARERFSSAQA